MKLLLDQNLSRRLLPLLAPSFAGSTHVQLLGMETADDRAIWDFAGSEGFAVVTKDADFVEIGMVGGFPPKIVWLNCGNVSNARLHEVLIAHTDAIIAFLAAGGEGVLEIE